MSGIGRPEVQEYSTPRFGSTGVALALGHWPTSVPHSGDFGAPIGLGVAFECNLGRSESYAAPLTGKAVTPNVLLLIDSARLTRECLSHLLATQLANFEIVSVAHAQQIAESGGVRPDVVLLNVGSARLADGPLHNDIATISARTRRAPMLLLSEHGEPSEEIQAAEYGMAGLFPLTFGLSLLIAAINLVVAGGQFRIPVSSERNTLHASTAIAEGGFDRPGGVTMGSLFPSLSWRAVCESGEVSCAPPSDRLVLIERHGLLRDRLASLIATRIPEAFLQCFSGVEDVTPGPAALVLISFDPTRGDNGEEMRAKLCDLRTLCGHAPIGVVLACDDAATKRALAALGVAGIIRHDEALAVAIAAIQLMWVGGFYLPPDLALDVDGAPTWSPQVGASLARPLAPAERKGFHREPYAEFALTSRECDVLRVLREGRQNKSIAFELGISESTVKVHLRNIMKKLHASNRTQVALGAIQGNESKLTNARRSAWNDL